MITLKSAVILAAGGYVAVVALLFFAQRRMLYHPDGTHLSPTQAGMPQAAEIVLRTRDGERLLAWHAPPRPDRMLVIYFHGNAEILPWRAARFCALTVDGTGLLAVSYRGYSTSTGHPTEAGLRLDALAAYDFAVARYGAERIALWGHSLGSGVAVRLAAERKIGKLVLETPFLSALSIASAMFPFAPVRLLMRDQFRSDQRIGAVTAPVLIAHGERDTVIPIASGEKLFALVHSPKRFVRYPLGDHINLDDFGFVAEVQKFLAAPTAAESLN